MLKQEQRMMKAIFSHGLAWKAAAVALALAGWTGTASAQLNLNFLPGDAAIAPAVNYQTAPAIARGGNTTLAVWVITDADSKLPQRFYRGVSP